MTRQLIPPLPGSTASARSVALEVLLDCQRGEAFVQEVLNDHLDHSGLAGPDRRLTTQLAYGVLRRRGSLDALLRAVSKRSQRQVEPLLWEILRLGTFQLALLTHIPMHAAVHETVELVDLFSAAGSAGAKGFVNGVLRGLSRLLTGEGTAAPAANALPLEDGQYAVLARPMLPDPAAFPAKYLAAGFSLPAWLAERWAARFPWDECVRLGFWFAGSASLWLRCNALKVDGATFLATLAKTGIAAEPGEMAQSVRVHDAVVIRELPGYDQGWFAVQDASAMKAAAALSPFPGSHVLDLCAAPGGKTTHLAELMHNQGTIVACDVNQRRLETVAELARRLGHTIVEPHHIDVHAGGEPPPGPFDAALVDVPCSNTGVLGRRPEVRWRVKKKDFPRLVALQKTLLRQAVERVRPGGVIVYSTCSIEPEENRQVVEAVLQDSPDLVLEADEEQSPGRPADGGYWARLRRRPN